ncbi:MAG: hypothetical protein ACK45B_10965 [Limisphaerales bacterium]
MKHPTKSIPSFALATLVGVLLVMTPVTSLTGPPFYNPCRGDRRDESGSCEHWRGIVCTTIGSPDGKCRIISDPPPCSGWSIGGVPDNVCRGHCYGRMQQTSIACETRYIERTGTRIVADPYCPETPNPGCVTDCLNRQNIENETFTFPWHELFDCIDPGG